MKLLAWSCGILWIRTFKGSAWSSKFWAQSFNQELLLAIGVQQESSLSQLVVKAE